MDIISIEKEYRGSKKATNSFFHYTSPEAFKNIVENGSLRFTNCMFLNDEEEYNYIFKVFDAIADEKIEDSSHSFIDSMRDAFSKENEDLDSPDGGFFSIKDAKASYYVLCGSIDGDSIPLWNYYVKDGQHYGYAIRFDAKEMFQKLKDINRKFIYGQIVYDLDEQKKIIFDYLDSLNRKYNIDLESFNDYDIDNYQSDYYDFVQCIRLFFKDKSFEHEKEFRIAVLIRDKDEDIKKGFFARNGVITPYVDIPFRNKLPIDKIVVSRSIDEDIGKKGIIELLLSKSYDVGKLMVSKSQVRVRF